ncbi:MAG: beta-lactamase family protein [Cyclobacteriaceae bacterium]
MKHSLALLALLGLITFLLSFDTDRPTAPTETHPKVVNKDTSVVLQDTTFLGFERLFQQNLKKNGCPGAALVIVKDTTVLVMNGYGVRDITTEDSVDVSTAFRIGSVSKGFAGILTGILTQSTDLDWESRVKDVLPSFALSDSLQTNRIEVRHLLSHTVGLPRHSYTNLIEDGKSLDEIIPMLKGVNLISKEGRMMSYQNVTFSIIEKVSESFTNKSFDKLLREKIFDAANMQNASTSYQDILSTSNRAEPHYYNSRDKKYHKSRITRKYYNTIAAGGINASIEDMGNWLQVLLGNTEVISKAALDSVFTSEVNTSRNRKYFNRWPGVKKSYYAKGWRLIDFGSREIVYHGGYVNLYRSEIAVDRENRIAICALFNAPTKYSGKVIPTFFNYCDSLTMNNNRVSSTIN